MVVVVTTVQKRAAREHQVCRCDGTPALIASEMEDCLVIEIARHSHLVNPDVCLFVVSEVGDHRANENALLVNVAVKVS